MSKFSLIGALSIIISWRIINGMNHVDCNSILLKLPIERVSEQKTINFVETYSERAPKIFIKGSEENQLYIPSPSPTKDVSCSVNVNTVENSNEINLIHRKCNKNYIPLHERTRTLNDLRKHDTTENMEKAESYIKRYENRRKRIMENRVNQ